VGWVGAGSGWVWSDLGLGLGGVFLGLLYFFLSLSLFYIIELVFVGLFQWVVVVVGRMPGRPGQWQCKAEQLSTKKTTEYMEHVKKQPSKDV